MKRALVTGGSSPIGTAIAHRLAKEGFAVIMQAGRNSASAQATADAIRSAGGEADVISLDITDFARCDDALAILANEHPFQVYVHNAGLHRDMPFAGMGPDDWRAVIDVNLNGFFNTLRPIIMPMIRTRWGRIIAVSSLTAITGNRGQTNYGAAKGGYLPLAKSLTKEYAARGITANVIAPGLIETPDTVAMVNYEDLRKLCPMGRAGTPEDVAGLVGFLTSDQAGYISGQMIALDGGIS